MGHGLRSAGLKVGEQGELDEVVAGVKVEAVDRELDALERT